MVLSAVVLFAPIGCGASDGVALQRPGVGAEDETGNADGAPKGKNSGLVPGTEGAGATAGANGSDAAGGANGDDLGATPTSTSSKGLGGPTGQRELTSTGGLTYLINVPTAVAAKPRGLLVLLHGSTASNYRQFIPMMETVATAQNLIRISVLAPNGKGWNEGNQATAAELLHDLIQKDVLTKYDIDLSRFLFSGQSSGGGFLSSHFLPLHAKDYKGGAVMQCGAAAPVPAFTPDEATKAGLRLHFEITTGDTIWPASYQRAIAAYATAGMSLTKDDTKPGGHCAFDQQAVLQARVATLLP